MYDNLRALLAQYLAEAAEAEDTPPTEKERERLEDFIIWLEETNAAL